MRGFKRSDWLAVAGLVAAVLTVIGVDHFHHHAHAEVNLPVCEVVECWDCEAEDCPEKCVEVWRKAEEKLNQDEEVISETEWL